MKSRLVALLVEVETDATIEELERPGALNVTVEANGKHLSHACTVHQVDANVVRSPAKPDSQE